MTLEEAKAILAPIREAEAVVRYHESLARQTERQTRCASGEHSWVRNDIRARVPYCNYCGKEQMR